MHPGVRLNPPLAMYGHNAPAGYDGWKPYQLARHAPGGNLATCAGQAAQFQLQITVRNPAIAQSSQTARGSFLIAPATGPPHHVLEDSAPPNLPQISDSGSRQGGYPRAWRKSAAVYATSVTRTMDRTDMSRRSIQVRHGAPSAPRCTR